MNWNPFDAQRRKHDSSSGCCAFKDERYDAERDLYERNYNTLLEKDEKPEFRSCAVRRDPGLLERGLSTVKSDESTSEDAVCFQSGKMHSQTSTHKREGSVSVTVAVDDKMAGTPSTCNRNAVYDNTKANISSRNQWWTSVSLTDISPFHPLDKKSHVKVEYNNVVRQLLAVVSSIQQSCRLANLQCKESSDSPVQARVQTVSVPRPVELSIHLWRTRSTGNNNSSSSSKEMIVVEVQRVAGSAVQSRPLVRNILEAVQLACQDMHDDHDDDDDDDAVMVDHKKSEREDTCHYCGDNNIPVSTPHTHVNWRAIHLSNSILMGTSATNSVPVHLVNNSNAAAGPPFPAAALEMVFSLLILNRPGALNRALELLCIWTNVNETEIGTATSLALCILQQEEPVGQTSVPATRATTTTNCSTATTHHHLRTGHHHLPTNHAIATAAGIQIMKATIRDCILSLVWTGRWTPSLDTATADAAVSTETMDVAYYVSVEKEEQQYSYMALLILVQALMIVQHTTAPSILRDALVGISKFRSTDGSSSWSVGALVWLKLQRVQENPHMAYLAIHLLHILVLNNNNNSTATATATTNTVVGHALFDGVQHHQHDPPAFSSMTALLDSAQLYGRLHHSALERAATQLLECLQA